MPIDSKLIALVHCASRDRRFWNSSGYLIGDRLVLTALHGLVDVDTEAAVPVDPLGAEIALNGDTQERRGQLLWLQAELVWPAPGASHGGIDAALLRITDLSGSQVLYRSERSTVVAVTRNELPCETIGYPDAWGETARPNSRFPSDVIDLMTSGFDRGGGRIRDDRRLLRVSGDDRPARSEDWAGLSGAPVVCLEPPGLLGVVALRVEKLAGRLVYQPLAEIPAANLFWQISGLSRDGNPAGGALPMSGAFDVLSEVRTLGRSEERNRFGTMVERVTKPDPLPAQIIMVSGHRYDEVNHCVQRLADFAAMTLTTRAPKGHPPVNGRVVNLPLGSDRQGLEERARHFAVEWLKVLGVREAEAETIPNQEERLERIRKLVVNADAPRMIKLEHTRPEIGEDCTALARRLAEFAASLPRLFPPCFLFVTIQIGLEARGEPERCDLLYWNTKVDAVARLLRPALRVRIGAEVNEPFGFENLAPVSWDEISGWINGLAARGWRPTSNARFDVQDFFMGQAFPMWFTVRNLHSKLKMERVP